MHIGLLLGLGMFAASAPAAPSISSLSYDVVDIAGGGQSVVVNGTNIGSATGVDVSGTAATITANTSTTVTVTMPAKAAGSYNVTVTTAGGTSNALSVEYWSPAQLPSVFAVYDAEKNVTEASTAISKWEDQTASLDADQATAGLKPTWLATQFGSLHSVAGDGGDRLTFAARHSLATSDFAVFWVSKHTSTKATRDEYAGNCPLTIVGDSSGSVASSFGFDAGALCLMRYNLGWNATTRGSGLNDGTVRLHGWTFDYVTGAGDGVAKAYVGETQQGTDATFDWGAGNQPGIQDLLNGYSVTNHLDGMNGHVGAIVVVDAIPSGANLTKLHKWAQQRFGAA